MFQGQEVFKWCSRQPHSKRKNSYILTKVWHFVCEEEKNCCKSENLFWAILLPQVDFLYVVRVCFALLLHTTYHMHFLLPRGQNKDFKNSSLQQRDQSMSPLIYLKWETWR